jgi:AraC-like DNA-binding protein
LASQVDNLKSRGVLHPRAAEDHFELRLHSPAPDLSEVIQHYWSVRWDLRGREPYAQHTLSNPCVHLVVEPGRPRVYGVVTSRFTYVLRGKSRIFAIRFRPAGFRPFLGSRASRLADRSVPVPEVFGSEGDAFIEQVLSLEDESGRVEVADTFIRARLPAPDPVVATLNGIVDRIIADRRLTRVDDLAAKEGIGKRRLQRLFSEYVGVSPKWVIQRYRLHDAAERLDEGEDVDLAALALDLGYFDQAHFARAFKAVVGKPPGEYAEASARRAVGQRASCR